VSLQGAERPSSSTLAQPAPSEPPLQMMIVVCFLSVVAVVGAISNRLGCRSGRPVAAFMLAIMGAVVLWSAVIGRGQAA